MSNFDRVEGLFWAIIDLVWGLPFYILGRFLGSAWDAFSKGFDARSV